MKKYLLCLGILMLSLSVSAQRLLSWTPEFPTDGGNITFTIDCTKGNQGLLNYQGGASADVFVHIGVNTNLSTNPSDWRYVKFTNFNAATPEAKATVLGNNKYSFTITNIRAFFGVPAGETINKINCIFRTGNGSLKQVNSDGSDMYIPMYTAGQFATRFNLPPSEPRFIPFVEPINVSVGGTVTTQAVSSIAANLTLKLNGTTVASASSTNVINSVITIPTNCDQKITVEANNGTVTVKDSIQFTIPQATVIAPLPAGAIEGINYNPNNTAATFVLFAPNKTAVSMIGDFNNWLPNCASSMKKTADGNYWWTTLTGLVPGQEYRFQYLVDNSIRIPDPYCQKILDPFNDQFINSTTYPNLIPYPVGLTSDLVGVFQTAEPQYVWTTTNYVKPDKKNLMVYELLLRDFTAEHSYQSLMDSIQYFKNLGINAIELMPVNEFDGNESWGYNPAFFFAPDKYYGTKNKLKQFIDLCHANGIAVLLDVVYNHCTGAAPQAKLYWNAATNQPTPNNPWLNVTAPHPYSVFNDFNHTTAATKYLVDRSIKFWVDEYKIDGYRFDLGKGFTQTVTNTTTVENFDASRVAILNGYYDNLIVHHPSAYMILEFLAGNSPSSEEQAYANKGWMLWGNINTRYNQNTMAFTPNSNLSSVVYNSTERAFTTPALVGYMESHDEERLMYRNTTFGNSTPGYNTRDLNTALRQMEAAASVFFTVPGPKMVWQFGERGYDVSLFFGGSNVSNKPPRWEYMLVPERRRLYDSYKKMMDLRLQNPAIFNNTTFTYDLSDGGGLFRRFQIADPAASGQKVTVIANMDLVAQTRTINFQSTGSWSNYLTNGTGSGVNGATGSTFTLTNTSQSITLQPGEYHIYLSAAPCATTAPTVISPVTYCQNTIATALTATGTSLLWYTTASGGTGVSTAPVPATTTAGTIPYHVSQTLNGCEGPRAVINVIVNATPAAPTVNPTVIICKDSVMAPLTATGTNLLWYTTATGGIGSSTAPTPSSATVGTVNYYVTQTVNNCTSPRALIAVTTNAPSNAPTVTSTINYCQNATATALTATGSNLLWYTSATGGMGNAATPIPSTTTVGTINYFVSQNSNGCESPRARIAVVTSATPTAPVVSSPVTYCQNATATALTASGTNLLWYTVATGGTGSSTAPTPSTTAIGNTVFYVTQSNNGCESPRAAITVSITATTAAPTVVSPVNYCQNATATVLSATGTSLLWYTSATGGVGSTSAPLPSTANVGSTNFYVSQTQSCGESPRALITVNINAIPTAPAVTSNITYCQDTIRTPLTANGTNLLWYTTASGGIGTSVAPMPSRANVGTTNFHVSQTINGCESPRAVISVTINASPNAPGVTTPVTYCQSTTATPLVASGTGLLWYQTASGGTGSSSVPTPSTANAGTTLFYVSQSSSGCESPRATITVNINAATTAPSVTGAVTYCQGATATLLTATGTNLRWYTVATGGTATIVAPTPSTTTAGSTTFYVSQTGTCGEGPRAAIIVTINATPAAVTQLTSTNITLTSATLTWVGQAGNFYNVEYKVSSSSTWIVAATGITQNNFVLNNLTPATSYDWRVSTNCLNTPTTNFAQANFTTKDAITTNLIVVQGIGINLSPNPATNATKLTYSLTQSGQVGIVIYNSSGQQMKNLYNGNRPAGIYNLDFTNQLDNVAAGTYYIKVSQGSNSNTIPFIKL